MDMNIINISISVGGSIEHLNKNLTFKELIEHKFPYTGVHVLSSLFLFLILTNNAMTK